MLEISDLVVRYGAITALRGVSLEVRPGSVVAVLGPNGAGKSSLLRAIMGLVKPASGRIAVRGRSTFALAPEQVVRHGVSLVPEGRRVFNSLTVVENLRLGSTPTSASFASSSESVYRLFPALRPLAGRRAASLSGGEQQMLAIGRALMPRPSLLLMDEPSLGLAPKIVDHVFAAIAALRQADTAILLVEQNVGRALTVADSVVVLQKGVVVDSGPTPRFTPSAVAGSTLWGRFASPSSTEKPQLQ